MLRQDWPALYEEVADVVPTGPEREKNFFPRLDHITVYRFDIERMTGKAQTLPAVSEQWPAVDRTKTPNARAHQ